MMRRMHRVIVLHAQAPAKPAEGRACNGCGVCCAVAPCPLGQIVSRRRTGACNALLWHDAGQQYRCGLLAAPQQHLPAALHWAAPTLARVARRYIAAGIGCDSSLLVQPPPEDSPGGPVAAQG
jgi:hypothetical protein